MKAPCQLRHSGGTLIALAFYLWLVSVFGNLPCSEFGPVIAEGATWMPCSRPRFGNRVQGGGQRPQRLLHGGHPLLLHRGGAQGCSTTWRICSSSTTAGVAAPKSRAVTFLPPLVLSLLFPFGFLVAIGYAGAVATLWTCIIPPPAGLEGAGGPARRRWRGLSAPPAASS